MLKIYAPKAEFHRFSIAVVVEADSDIFQLCHSIPGSSRLKD